MSVAQLIDIMMKNRLQSELVQSRLETLEYASLRSKDIAENHFVKDLIDPRKHFSKGALRNFEQIKEVLQRYSLGPRPDYEAEIEQKLQELYFENDFLKYETERVAVNNAGILKPRFESKLTLRDTLESLYEGRLQGMSKEMQCLTLKLKTDNRRVLDQLANGSQELKQIES